jgi:hypothetical protein
VLAITKQSNVRFQSFVPRIRDTQPGTALRQPFQVRIEETWLSVAYGNGLE